MNRFLRARLFNLGALCCCAALAPVGCHAADHQGENNPESSLLAAMGSDAGPSQMSVFMFSVSDLVSELKLTATTTATQSGPFSDPATWGGKPPGTGAVVVVPRGLTVTVDTVTAPLKAVVVRGTLGFDPTKSASKNATLNVDTLLVDMGTLEMGTPTAPIGAGYQAIIDFPDAPPAFSTTEDPRTVTRGLISDGTLIMNGALKTPFVSLAQDAHQGDTTLSLATAPTGWAVGDTIVLAATTFEPGYTLPQDLPHNETRTIHAISGTTVTLDQALAYDHVPPQGAPAGLHAHVANLTRNVVLRSPSTVPALSYRGHVMQMTNHAQISGVLFDHLGRTDKTRPVNDPVLDTTGAILPGTNPRARYSIHFHEAGAMPTDLMGPEAVVDHSVVWGSPGWGFVNHSSYVNFNNDVAFDFSGAGFACEDGDEAGAVIHNIAIGGRGTGGTEMQHEVREVFGNAQRINQGDMGFAGHGFWFQGPDVTIEHNVSAGNKGDGFVIWADGKYDPAAGDYTSFPMGRVKTGVNPAYFTPDFACINDVPLRSFAYNEAYGSFVGLKIRFTNDFGANPMVVNGHDYYDDLTGRGGFQPSASLVQSSKLWSNWIGLVPSYTTMSFQDVQIIAGDPQAPGPSSPPASQGIYVTGPHTLNFSNVTVIGYPTDVYLNLTTCPSTPPTIFPGITTSGGTAFRSNCP